MDEQGIRFLIKKTLHCSGYFSCNVIDKLSFKKFFGMNVSIYLLLILVLHAFFMKVCELLSWKLASCGDKTGKH